MDTKFRFFMEPEVVMRRREFSREFKIEAVKLVRERGVSVAQAGRHEVRLHCEAPEYLAGGMAMQCDGRVTVGLPCLAE